MAGTTVCEKHRESYQTFQDLLSAAVVCRLSGPKRRSGKQRRKSGKGSALAHPSVVVKIEESTAQIAEELSDFVEVRISSTEMASFRSALSLVALAIGQ